jgi:hypothetical protein
VGKEVIDSARIDVHDGRNTVVSLRRAWSACRLIVPGFSKSTARQAVAGHLGFLAMDSSGKATNSVMADSDANRDRVLKAALDCRVELMAYAPRCWKYSERSSKSKPVWPRRHCTSVKARCG